MMNALALVDGDYARRARIVRYFAEQRCHVEPFESLREFALVPHDQRLVLVHDEPGLISSVLDYCLDRGQVISVVAYGEHPTAEAVVAALKLGALDYADWSHGVDTMFSKLSGWLDAACAEWPQRERELSSKRLVERLTRREREILTYITMGHSTRSISEHLLISYRTVELHRAHVLEKLVASNSSAAVRIAMEAGIAV